MYILSDMQKVVMAGVGVAIVIAIIGFVVFKGNPTPTSTPTPNTASLATTLPTSTPITSPAPSGKGATITPSATPKIVMNKDGFIIEDITDGTGDVAVSGKMITVNYKGTLTNGKQFDSSYDHGTPFSFQLGAGDVIKGWDQGFAGMKVGGKRKLTIPPELGYGVNGAGASIPPNATLIFEVELLKVAQ